ncbi:unnamed protein product [Caenorhabditis bovis]|uniref:AMP-dependent synthetase/ligase domain-containing protein n=1 Tax=Caenorhabditis bovis TaxID=2654633 RepID=A0A8S1EH98_9PELO|nr:unnamed protein product [Caenorhabditis bovis]
MPKNLIETCLKIDENFRKPDDIGLIWEGNYWDDHDVHDCCEIDWETIEILVRKIGKAIENCIINDEHGKNIVVAVPKIMQLPLIIMACYKIGMVPVIVDPTIKRFPMEIPVSLVITVDAFWQAQDLIIVKKGLEAIFENIPFLVLRHVAPNPGVPPPKKHLPARRPYYKTTLEMRDVFDFEWTDVMSAIDRNVKLADHRWSDDETVAILLNPRSSTKVRHSELVEALDRKLSNFENLLRVDLNIENLMILDPLDCLDNLANFLLPWALSKSLTIYEGPLDYPDSSRLAQIIEKHNVDVLIGSKADYKIPNPEYLNFFPTDKLKILITPCELLKEKLQVDNNAETI